MDTRNHTKRIVVAPALVVALLISACAPLTPAASPAGRTDSDGHMVGEMTGDENSSAAGTDWSRSAGPERAEESAPAVLAGDTAAASTSIRGSRSSPPLPTRAQQPRSEPVTAGVVDDNEQWDAYLDYRADHRWVNANDRDVSERYLIYVTDERGYPVHDAGITVFLDEREVFRGRTDTGGRVLFHPRAIDTLMRAQSQQREFRVVAEKGWVAQSQTFLRNSDPRWTLTLAEPPRGQATNLDLLFLVDATGSMDDEIGKLKASMADIADEISRLPEMPDVRYGLVAYRDQGDAFVVRDYDFTHDLGQFQRILSSVRADGGGDEPEALNEALNTAIHRMGWRENDTVRMIVLVADAPPHLDYGWEQFSYDADMFAAVAGGIKIFPVGASGLNEDGEYIFRQLAQVTGGKFVFLTYADGSDPRSGPGTETEHDVENYSVDVLDRLIVRLVQDELAKLSMPAASGRSNSTGQPSLPQNQQEPPAISCELAVVELNFNDCHRLGNAIAELENGVLRITLDPQTTGYTRARFQVHYNQPSVGYSVHIGDSISNNGDAGDYGDQSNDAEMQVVDSTLSVFANDYQGKTEADRLLRKWDGVAGPGHDLIFEIADNRVKVAGQGTVESPYLFALNGQWDDEGPVNFDIYAAFNRNITGDRRGIGVERVAITLFGE